MHKLHSYILESTISSKSQTYMGSSHAHLWT